MVYPMQALEYNPLTVPSYQLIDAARYLHVPYPTLHSWTASRGRSKAVIKLALADPPTLSFMDLIECWVLASLRNREGISMGKVRSAVETLRLKYNSRHPLAEKEFQTDGVDLFVKESVVLVNVSKAAQFVFRDIVEAHLRRIERDDAGLARRLFPFTRARQLKSKVDVPKLIMIDPLISFGRPVLRGTAVCTSVLASRFRGGDSIESLAREYGRKQSEIKEAIYWERTAAAA
jgi:uncharacterized protein (DUF433 family)